MATNREIREARGFPRPHSEIVAEAAAEALIEARRYTSSPESRGLMDTVLGSLFERAGISATRSTRSGRQEDPLYEGLPEPKAPLGSMYRIWGS